MLKNTLMGLDELLLEVPDQIERAYFEEAAKCYHIEAYRAAVILSWIVTARNLEKKLEQLATEDGESKGYWTKIDAKKKNEQVYEEDLIDAFKALGILDEQETKDLKHLRDTRNWCAHPTNYEPKAEKVRHCLRSAVELALSRPPVRGFVYIRSLAEESVKDPFFLPSRETSTIDSHVHEMLGRLRGDLYIKLVEWMLRTYRDKGATPLTQENIRLFLTSMVRQSSDRLQEIVQAIQPLLDSDLRAASIILGSRSESLNYLSNLGRDRIISFVITEVSAGAIPDKPMLRVLEEIVRTGSFDANQLQISTKLRVHIYKIYPELEDKDSSFFTEILLERLESDLGETDYDKANPAGRFVQRVGLSSFNTLSTSSQKRLADALAIAACGNAFGALPFFTNPQVVDNTWLRLLLDGLARHFLFNGQYYTNEVVISPFMEWINRGNDLTEGWKDLLRESLEAQERVSQDEEDSDPSILWINSSPNSIRQLAQSLTEATERLEARTYDTSLIRGIVEYLQTNYPRYFTKKSESVE
jgi:hypothetical protein